jgi:ABC-type transport system involved in multi-copper enzyme maturation permease subunit
MNTSTTYAVRPTALRAEWTKYQTLRSTWITLGISVIAALALSVVATASDVREWDDMSRAQQTAFDPTSTALVGVLFGALVLGALGVRTITAEYATGMIRATAAAIPRRSRILLAKAGIVAVSAFLAALFANVAAFIIGQRILQAKAIDAPLGDSNSVSAIAAGAIAVSAFAVIGVGLGAIVRRAAVANVVLALVMIGGQLVGSAMPMTSQKYLPFSALQASVTVERANDLLSPLAAVAILTGYAAAALVAGLYLLERRDV